MTNRPHSRYPGQDAGRSTTARRRKTDPDKARARRQRS